MDQHMHELWLRAERRIDAALAGLVTSLLWIVGVPLTAALTPLTFSADVFLCAAFGIVGIIIFLRPFREGLRVARAIEERDAEEVLRWVDTGIPPVHLGLLRARRQRVHYPMLAVFTLGSFFFTLLALHNLLTPASKLDAYFAAGVLCGAIGLFGISLVGFYTQSLPERRLHFLLFLMAFPLLVAGVFLSLALIIGRDSFASLEFSHTVQSVVLMIVGIIVALVTLLLILVWLYAGFVLVRGGGRDSGLRALVTELSHMDPADITAQLVGGKRDHERADVDERLRKHGFSWSDAGAAPLEAEEEFDEEDLALIRAALEPSRVDQFLAASLIALSVSIVILYELHLVGTIFHGFAGLLLLAIAGISVHRTRTLI